jgi:hypothetical protein
VLGSNSAWSGAGFHSVPARFVDLVQQMMVMDPDTISNTKPTCVAPTAV